MKHFKHWAIAAFTLTLASCMPMETFASGLPELPLPPAPPALPAASGFQTYGQGMPLSEFLKTTLGDIAHKPYILAPEAATAQTLIAADLSHMRGKKDIVGLVKDIIGSMGLSIREAQGVLIVEKKKEAEKEKAKDTMVYRPKHRTVGSLAPYLSVFPDVQFSSSQGLSVKAPTAAPAAQPGEGLQKTMSAGGTTFSQFNQDPDFLVAKGTPQDLKAMRKLLDSIDTPIPMAVIHAYIFQISNTKHDESGLSLTASILGNKLGINTGAVSNGDTIRLGLANVNVAVKALAQDGRAKLISTPVLSIKNGSSGSYNIGKDTPVLNGTVMSNGNTQQNVGYQSAGDIMNVSARVLEKSIQLTISQEVSDFEATTTGVNNSPTKTKEAFQSEVIAKDGEIFLLGGLSKHNETESKSHGLFGIFSGNQGDQSDSELVVLLKVDKMLVDEK